MFDPINLINQGVVPGPSASNLTFNTSAGSLYGLGIGYVNDRLNPDKIDVSATSPCTFQYRTQLGGTFSNTTLIDPTVYDLDGVVTPIPGGSSIQLRIREYISYKMVYLEFNMGRYYIQHLQKLLLVLRQKTLKLS